MEQTVPQLQPMARNVLKRGRHRSWCHSLVSIAMIIIYTSAFAIAGAAAEVQGAAAHRGVTPRPPVDPKASSYVIARASMSNRSPNTADDYDLLTTPFFVSSERVGGAISNSMQTELESEDGNGHDTSAGGASRSLLHGKPHKPNKFPKCNKCKMVKCPRPGYCSGHCKKKGRVHFCDSKTVSAPATEPGPCANDSDTDETHQNSIEEFDTVVVTAEAPYIGCANIANRPTGCPARGTRARLPGRRQVRVLASRCRAEPYVPDCEVPLLPFGVCECFYREDPRRPPGGRPPARPSRPRIIRTACSTTELAAGSGVGGADGSPSEDGLVVQPAGDLTLTWFSNFTEPEQHSAFTYSVTATVGTIDVDVSLDIYPGIVMDADFVADDPISTDPEDYDMHDYDAVEIE